MIFFQRNAICSFGDEARPTDKAYHAQYLFNQFFLSFVRREESLDFQVGIQVLYITILCSSGS